MGRVRRARCANHHRGIHGVGEQRRAASPPRPARRRLPPSRCHRSPAAPARAGQRQSARRRARCRRRTVGAARLRRRPLIRRLPRTVAQRRAPRPRRGRPRGRARLPRLPHAAGGCEFVPPRVVPLITLPSTVPMGTASDDGGDVARRSSARHRGNPAPRHYSSVTCSRASWTRPRT
jgi:hypothetical protein